MLFREWPVQTTKMARHNMWGGVRALPFLEFKLIKRETLRIINWSVLLLIRQFKLRNKNVFRTDPATGRWVQTVKLQRA
jgi:hypothetical protein